MNVEGATQRRHDAGDRDNISLGRSTCDDWYSDSWTDRWLTRLVNLVRSLQPDEALPVAIAHNLKTECARRIGRRFILGKPYFKFYELLIIASW